MGRLIVPFQYTIGAVARIKPLCDILRLWPAFVILHLAAGWTINTIHIAENYSVAYEPDSCKMLDW